MAIVRAFFKKGRPRADMNRVSRFMEYAAGILETVESTLASGQNPSEMTILIERGGGLRMIAGSDWPLDSLERERGAQMAYRVSSQRETVRVEGRAGAASCVLETPRPSRAARLLLSSPLPPHYSTTRAIASGDEGESMAEKAYRS